MKKLLILGFLALSSMPAFGQVDRKAPVMVVSVTSTVLSYTLEGQYLNFLGVGASIEFMIGGRFYFYANLLGDYLFSFNTMPNSMQLGFVTGFGYIIKNNLDEKGFSFAINIAPLGVAVDMRSPGTPSLTSAVIYKSFISFPFRFHYAGTRSVQLAPYIVLGATTWQKTYNFLISGGVTLGITF